MLIRAGKSSISDTVVVKATMVSEINSKIKDKFLQRLQFLENQADVNHSFLRLRVSIRASWVKCLLIN